MAQQVKKYILSQVAKQQLSKEEAKAMLLDLTDHEAKNEKIGKMDIAIIGMAGRFSKASNPDEFWELLKKGENCIRDFPEARFKDMEHILRNPHYSEFLFGKAIEYEDIPYVHAKSGYLDEIDKFDAHFFGIPPNEAIYMDPQHRVALEVAWAAMEDAGYGGNSLIGSRTGVYLGKEGTNYSYYQHSSEGNPMQLTGSWESLMVSRISHLFDFKGPCMLVDTACSAGLVSIHVAGQALLTGDCDLALAGGINLSIFGELKSNYRSVNLGEVEANDGLIRTFDARAKGTVWGEGAGMVVLKPLQQALEDGDHIHAVIKASAINNDGASNSLTAPRAETQEEVIITAWQKAGIPPESISYIEAHGTGTILGDPIEVKGLSNAFRRFTLRKQFCAIGSLKTNMGHMVEASGIASLIKVVKSIEHKELAPTINFEIPNPYINFVNSPLYVNDTLLPWETNGEPRRAALSSFGFSRTNCHMVIEEAPDREISEATQASYCLTISAKTKVAMDHYIRNYAHFLEGESWTLPDLCYTSNIGRGHYEHRAVFIAETEDELRGFIRAFVMQGNDASNLPGAYVGHYQIVSEKKKLLEEGEISKHERGKLTDQAMKKLHDFIGKKRSVKRLLEEVCLLYIQGADVDWKVYYQGEARRRIPLPVYPFQKTRYWAKPKVGETRSQRQLVLHPLVEQQLSSPPGVYQYETIFRVDQHWVLKDHRIGKMAVLPGTSYLEMVRFAAAKGFGQDSLEFQDVVFLSPLMVEDDGECVVRLTLSSTPTAGFSFSVTSLTKTGERIPHVEGRVFALKAGAECQTADLETLKSRAHKTLVADFKDYHSDVFTFGPHWDTVRTVWYNSSATLAQLQLREDLQHELDIYKLHPSLLDNGVNLTSQDMGDTYLPFMYKTIRLYAPLTNDMYTYVQLKDDKVGKGETMTYNVDLLDSKGRILAEIRDYTVKRVRDISLLENNLKAGTCLQMHWIPRETKSNESTLTSSYNSVALIATLGFRAQELEATIRSFGLEVDTFYLETGKGDETDFTYSPNEEGFDALLTAAEDGGVKTILFAPDFCLGDEERDQLIDSDGVFNHRQRVGVHACFQLCKRLIIRKSKQIKHFKVLVQDAWEVDGSETYINPLSAATAALTKVIGQEYRHLAVDVLDVANTVPFPSAVKECFLGSGYRALRQSGVFVEELRPHFVSLTNELELSSEGVYIITGGLGGLGLAIANRLASKGNVNVVLIGRSSIASADEWETLAKSGDIKTSERYGHLLDLQARLNRLEYISMDVADAQAVQSLGESLKNSYGDILGIFHAAGVAGDGYLMLKDEKEFDKVLKPKIDGSINLMRILSNDPSCFMVMFSSITALTGGEGQGDYCAANAFLDSLAEKGRLAGLRILSVNWTSWREVGMSVDYQIDEESSLFSAIGVEEGLDWLENLILQPQKRIVPANLNIPLALELGNKLPFTLSLELTQKLNAFREVATGVQATARVQTVENVEVIIKGTKEPTETQRVIAHAFSSLLGLKEIDIYASFQDMGGNSLMTTQLLSIIEQHYPGVVDISDIFSYPSVQALSESIDDRTIGIASEQALDSEKDKVDINLVDLIEEELQGTEFLEQFMDQLKGRKEDDK